MPEGTVSAGWVRVESWLTAEGEHQFQVDWDEGTEWITLLGLLEAAKVGLVESTEEVDDG